MEWMWLPALQVHTSRWFQQSNWLQAAEGEIDASSISFLHSVLEVPEDGPTGIGWRATGRRISS